MMGMRRRERDIKADRVYANKRFYNHIIIYYMVFNKLIYRNQFNYFYGLTRSNDISKEWSRHIQVQTHTDILKARTEFVCNDRYQCSQY